jgi:PPP family 3-phenylpropionic acid transporter
MRAAMRDTQPATDDERFGFAARISLYFGCLFVVFGVMQPWLNVWYVHRGLTLAEVAAISNIAPLVRMVATPTVSILADRAQAHRTVMIASSWGYVAALLAMSQASGFSALLAGQIVVVITGAALIPLTDAQAIAGVRARGLEYGRMRLWGSITFIVASIVSGLLVERYDVGIAMGLMVAGAFAAALAAHALPRPETTAASRPPMRLADTLALARAPVFLLFLITGGALQGAHAMLNLYSVLHWQSVGISSAWSGVLWAIGVVAEIILFARAGRWFAGWSPLQVMALGGGVSVLRWIALALDPPLGVLLPLQVLHGVTFGASHLGAMLFLGRAVPEAQSATGQGLYALMVAGLAGAACAWLAGEAFQAYGGRAYLAMAAIAAVSLASLAVLARRWDGGQLRLGG